MEDKPYALQDVSEQKRRAEKMSEPHMAPLAAFVSRLRETRKDTPASDIPHFDPCDGGIRAKALFLLEAPGPKAVSTGFVSRNNPDPTAKNLGLFLHDARIARRDTIIGNIVPWYVGASDHSRIRAVHPRDIQEALPHLQALLTLLPNLEVIVLMGLRAQSAEASLRKLTNILFIKTYHTSGQVINTRPKHKADIQTKLTQVAALLHHGQAT